MGTGIRVIVAARSDVFCEGVKSILEHHGIDVLDLWLDLAAAASPVMLESDPHIILVHFSFLSSGHLQEVERIHLLYPTARIVLLVDLNDRGMLDLAAKAPVHSVVSNALSGQSICHVLGLVAAGEQVFPPPSALAAGFAPGDADGHSAAPRLLTDGAGREHPVPSLGQRLSTREVDVVRCLTRGYPNKVIARQLDISEATVKVHIKAILRKTGARNRTEVALLATQAANHV